MNVYEQLAKAGAKVIYFCAYCGHAAGSWRTSASPW
jgi:hypothetical protein